MGADVVIVGAGSAGSVLAERLSADPACRVTVLEAGPARTAPAIRALTDPADRLPVEPASPVAWRYRTALTEHPRTAAEIVRGRCVGGSGAINGGYFCRALPADFDEYPVPGWSWADVEPHYRAIATDRDFPDPRGGGPIPIRRVLSADAPARGALSTGAFVGAAVDAGFRWLPDLNATPAGPSPPPGVGAVPLNIAGGVRVGPGAAFLEPALGRPNLTVLTDTRATRVRIAAGRAVGVDLTGPDGPGRLDAHRVVLSAGALESADLLMLSGVGPAGALAALGIRVLADLPVGVRCRDHPEWLLPTGWAPSPGHPVLEAVLVTGALEIRPYTTGFGAGTTSIGVALMRPGSRGRVSLVSADPAVPPSIEHRYDGDPADGAALREGCESVAEVLGGVTELGEPSWSTSQHLCGTAPMGTGEDAVVDPRCRVLGVDGLWVVDASVLPSIPGRGPHATVAMLGHRAAEFIRA